MMNMNYYQISAEELGKNARFIGARGLKGFRNRQRADEFERNR